MLTMQLHRTSSSHENSAAYSDTCCWCLSWRLWRWCGVCRGRSYGATASQFDYYPSSSPAIGEFETSWFVPHQWEWQSVVVGWWKSWTIELSYNRRPTKVSLFLPEVTCGYTKCTRTRFLFTRIQIESTESQSHLPLLSHAFSRLSFWI